MAISQKLSLIGILKEISGKKDKPKTKINLNYQYKGPVIEIQPMCRTTH